MYESSSNSSHNPSLIPPAGASSLRTVQFHSFLLVGISGWLELIEDWVEHGTDVHFIFYEELLQNPLAEMVRLLKHFNIPFSKLRLEYLSSSLEGQFHRSNHIEVDPFTSEQKRVVDMAN